MVSGQPVVAKKKKFFFGKSFLYIKRNFLSHRASLYLAPRVRMRRASSPSHETSWQARERRGGITENTISPDKYFNLLSLSLLEHVGLGKTGRVMSASLCGSAH